jgi:hypothetical protein
MDINHIELTPASLAGLYKRHLVESGTSTAPPVEPVTRPVPSSTEIPVQEDKAMITGIKSLGSNARHVLVLVNHPETVFLPDAELKFLTGILAACKLNLADVAIVNLYHHPGTGYKELLSYFNCKQALLFGLEPTAIGLPLSFPEFQLQAFNGTTYHWSPELSKMENDRTLKTRLWNNLKIVFTL